LGSKKGIVEKMTSLQFKTDVELFEFIKLVHSLQNRKNRAIHEGRTWKVCQKMNNMRLQTYRFINTYLTIEKNFKRQAFMEDTELIILSESFS
jgi:hypothetical protein